MKAEISARLRGVDLDSIFKIIGKYTDLITANVNHVEGESGIFHCDAECTVKKGFENSQLSSRIRDEFIKNKIFDFTVGTKSI